VKAALGFLALIVCLPSFAEAQSLRCGGKLITEGTSQAEVAARCGQPTQIDRQTLYSEGGAAGLPGGPRPGNAAPLLPGIAGRSGSEVSGEVWTYNFGPSRLMERIRFENGIAVKIESLGYGF
jgi:hypothetical protein